MEELGMRLEGIQQSQTRDTRNNWAQLYFYGWRKTGENNRIRS